LPPFSPPAARNAGFHTHTSPRRLRFDSLRSDHRQVFSTTFSRWREYTDIPASLVTCAHGPYPAQTASGTTRFQSMAWEITEVDTARLTGTW
jgi:hypothetical protein